MPIYSILMILFVVIGILGLFYKSYVYLLIMNCGMFIMNLYILLFVPNYPQSLAILFIIIFGLYTGWHLGQHEDI